MVIEVLGQRYGLEVRGKTWNEGILTIDGRIAFCADYTKRFESGSYYDFNGCFNLF